MYKLIEESVFIVKLNEDGSMTSFPPSEDNVDYVEYLKWLSEGNEPEPAGE